jgi:BirA family transcriptional regulator, biotin operon repressor / biotin---[acetyl-CoA-carboxylase] ligase
MDSLDSLDSKKINELLGKSIFSGNIIIHQSLSSTNNTAKDLYLKGAAHGTIVMAEEQTAGRGRMERKWFSPPYKNILFSILLRPDMKAENVYALTLALAVSGIDAIKAICNLSAMIKWPNDIYSNNKKLAGILTEFSIRGKTPAYVVLGMGLNANWGPDESPDILFTPTSLIQETGAPVSRNRLMAVILKRFEYLYNDIINERMEEFIIRCNGLSLLTGKKVSVDTGDEIISGKAIGIDKDGGLFIEMQDGDKKKILNGDVSLRF